ncbi:MAG TPA: peroxiredoxin family protein [bacterium]|nr:peroxiredoxin family protein [bacterium]
MLSVTIGLAILAGFFQGCVKPSVPQATKPGGLGLGDKAYDFSLMDSSGHPVKMSDLKPGWYLVLILYRGSWCSACQGQLAGLKEDYPKFLAQNATVAAVSVDSIEDSANFNQQWRFPFPLLSDPDLKVIDAYGARLPNGHEGKDIAKPTTLIIDPNKTIRFKYIGKDPTDRPTDNEILFMLQQIQQHDSGKK